MVVMGPRVREDDGHTDSDFKQPKIIQVWIVIASASEAIYRAQEKMDCFVAGAPRNDSKTHLRIAAAWIAPGFCVNSSPFNSEGAGNAGRSARPQPRAQW